MSTLTRTVPMQANNDESRGSGEAGSSQHGDAASEHADGPAVLQRSVKLGSCSSQPAGVPSAAGDQPASFPLSFNCLDAHLSKLLAKVGGEAALVPTLTPSSDIFCPNDALSRRFELHVVAHVCT